MTQPTRVLQRGRTASSRANATPGLQATNSPWVGQVEGIAEGVIFGWAIHAHNVQARVVIEVCLNDEPITSTTADIARSDITPVLQHYFSDAAGFDCCHGFAVSISPLGDGATGSVSVRIANTPIVLPGPIDISDAPTPPVGATSMVYSDGDLTLHGWVAENMGQTQATTVRAYIGGEVVAQSVANLTSPLVRSLNYAAQGFVLRLPMSLADGQRHQVRVVDGSGRPLNGSPIAVCMLANGVRTLLTDEQALLADLLEDYQARLPRNVGIQQYRQWSERFAFPPPTPKSSTKKRPTVGVIVSGEGTDAALAQTLASLKQQVAVRVNPQVLAVRNRIQKPLHEAIRSLQESGVDAVAFVRIGDTLASTALHLAMQGFSNPDAQVVYTDSVLKSTPWFKPAWSLEYALATDYPLELMLARTSALEACVAAGATPQTVALLAWRLLLRAHQSHPGAIVHIPHVLYQFESALTHSERSERLRAAKLALKDIESTASLEHLTDSLEQPTSAARGLRRRVSPKNKKIRISIIIPTRDHPDLLQRCIGSLQQFTDLSRVEIMVVDNGSVLPKTKTLFQEITQQGVQVLHMPGPFNFAALNNRAVEAATGEVVCLINNDIEALHLGWLDEMLSHLLASDVAAVGAKLLWPNAMVQHGGVLLGVGNVAGHFGNWLSDADWGDHGRNQLVQRVSAVTAACMLIRKHDYLRVGGMNEHLFPVAFNDVDLCLKLRHLGKSIVWTPFAKLLHAESASRGSEDTPAKKSRARREVDNLRKVWGPALLRDPFYHPSLNLDSLGAPFSALAMPPRDRSPRTPVLGT